MTELLVTNGRILDPANGIDTAADLLISDGKIKRIGKSLSKDFSGERIDAKGKLVVPGLIDVQVHFREPGQESKETIETGLRSALKGGVTTVVTMPNTVPVIDSRGAIELLKNRAGKLQLGNLYPAGAITKAQKGEELADIWDMKQAGAVAVSDDGKDIQNEGLLKKAMAYARTHDLVVMSHCQCEKLSAGGLLHDGLVAAKLGLPGIPTSAEDLAVLKNLILAEETGARLHILHVATKGAVEFIALFQKRGVKVTAETCPQYFCLTDEACDGYNTNAKMYPPLRPEEHRRAIIAGLKSGVLAVISTDHAPHTCWDKLQSFEKASWGSVGLETSFALGYTHLVLSKALSLKELVAKMTINPAKTLGLPHGTLKAGARADVAIFDLNRKWTVAVEKMETKGRNCVFEGMKIQGKAETVLVNGEIKMRNEEILPY